MKRDHPLSKLARDEHEAREEIRALRRKQRLGNRLDTREQLRAQPAPQAPTKTLDEFHARREAQDVEIARQ